MNVGERVNDLYEYLIDTLTLSVEEVDIIKTAIRNITEIAPTDAPLIMRKISDLIVSSDNISWVIHIINRSIHINNRELKTIRDPSVVMLVRQGRPSRDAIDSEVRLGNSKIYQLEENISILENVLDYLKHLELSLSNYQWLLRDKLKFSD
jgi:hypothetical protein